MNVYGPYILYEYGWEISSNKLECYNIFIQRIGHNTIRNKFLFNNKQFKVIL